MRREMSDELYLRASSLSNELTLSEVVSKLLVVRGFEEQAEAEAFLAPSLKAHLPDPRNLSGLQQAAAKILEAIAEELTITIFTDFDVDGLTAGSQLQLFLEKAGARVNHYTPNRFTEGYGLSKRALEKLVRARTELLITVDCGIANVEEIKSAKRAGMQVIVLDHHHADIAPPADIVVDPALKDEEFKVFNVCAAGLVWLLLVELRRQVRENDAASPSQLPDPKLFLDLAAVGTICDMVPLVGLNRVIVARGIEALKKTERTGLKALQVVAGISNPSRLSAGHISFGLGPRINAAGRLEDSKQVFELLTTNSIQKAQVIAEKLNKINAERRNIEERVKEACFNIISSEARTEQAGFALFHPEFHTGVIGIVAQRIVEKFHRPAAVMGLPAKEEVGTSGEPLIKGSVRGVEGFHVANALEELSNLLVNGGGHAQAGGFSLLPETLEEFQQGFVQIAERCLDPDSFRKRITADLELDLDEVTFELVEELSALAPFGIGNPSPVFITKDVEVSSVQSIKNGHLRVRISKKGKTLPGVAWRFQGHPHLRKGKRVAVAYQPEINSYQGVSSVQLNIREAWVE